MAGARALCRATGMTDDDFGKPIVAIANSYTQFVPGHVHLKNMGELVGQAVRRAGGIPREFSEFSKVVHGATHVWRASVHYRGASGYYRNQQMN